MVQVKCQYCHELVNKEEAMIYNYVSSSGKSKQKQYLHKQCYAPFMRNKQERKDLDELWTYIRTEIFKWDKGKKCPPHLVDRLQGLKSGQKNGYRAQGHRVFGNESGYSYHVILTTFKLCQMSIINGIANSGKFKNMNHMIDYMLAIVSNNINDVYFRMKAKAKSDKHVETIQITDNKESKFINKNDIKKNKVANKLKDMF